MIWHITNSATVHTRMTVGSCSAEYEYKLLCQFTATVEGTHPKQTCWL